MIQPPDPFGLRQCDRTLAIVEREIRELRGDEMKPKKRTIEVFDYVTREWRRIRGKPWDIEYDAISFTVRTIMRRYDLLDTEDMPKPRKPSDGHGDWGG